MASEPLGEKDVIYLNGMLFDAAARSRYGIEVAEVDAAAGLIKGHAIDSKGVWLYSEGGGRTPMQISGKVWHRKWGKL